MGRRPRNILPTSSEILKPYLPNAKVGKEHFNSQKEKKKFYHDQRGTKDLKRLPDGINVRISSSITWKPGVEIRKQEKPRSYVIRSDNRLYRRNRKHLRVSSEKSNKDNHDDTLEDVFDYQPSQLNDTNTPECDKQVNLSHNKIL